MLKCQEYQHPSFYGKTQTLKKMRNISMIAIFEPFADNSQINKYKLLRIMDNATCNHNGKFFWLFQSKDVECDILKGHDQHITCIVEHVEHNENFMDSCIYSKCKDHLRRPLLYKLFHFSNMDIPWCTIGDFNVITSTEEKYGGLPYNMNKSFDFINIIKACGLMDIGYNGQNFTQV